MCDDKIEAILKDIKNVMAPCLNHVKGDKLFNNCKDCKVILKKIKDAKK